MGALIIFSANVVQTSGNCFPSWPHWFRLGGSGTPFPAATRPQRGAPAAGGGAPPLPGAGAADRRLPRGRRPPPFPRERGRGQSSRRLGANMPQGLLFFQRRPAPTSTPIGSNVDGEVSPAQQRPNIPPPDAGPPRVTEKGPGINCPPGRRAGGGRDPFFDQHFCVPWTPIFWDPHFGAPFFGNSG